MSEMRKKHLTQLRKNQADSARDKTGTASNSLAGTLRFLAVSEFVLNQDKRTFVENLVEAATLRRNLIERFEAGEDISPSYVSMMSYKSLMDALAAGDVQAAKDIAAKMGGRSSIESEYDRPFDLAFGYALKHIVLSDVDSVGQWLDALEVASKDPENKDFAGYAKMLKAIVDKDVPQANAALSDVVAGHKRQCTGKGLCKDTEDELLCVWGVAVANLARMHGVQVDPIEPLIPRDLLV